jgi:exopolysaccharide production protein ExoZ
MMTPATNPVRGALPKLAHLQILRAIAASLVVVEHTLGSLRKAGAGPGADQDSRLYAGTAGVMAFFILSGLIMVVRSADEFGSVRNSVRFFYQRVVRIVPMYWIATIAWTARLASLGIRIPHRLAQLVYSFLFIPDFLVRNNKSNPIVTQGWTLNCEMAFYALFAVCLLLPRRRGLAGLLAVPPMMAMLGAFHPFPRASAAGAIMRLYTQPVVWLFAVGVLLGLVLLKLDGLSRLRLWVSPAWLMVVPPLVFLVFPTLQQSHLVAAWAVLQMFCAAVVGLCAMTAAEHPGWVTRTLVRLGDASYSTYLFHMWIFAWLVPLALKMGSGAASVALPIVAAVVTANALGWLIYRLVERPLTRTLHRLGRGEERRRVDEAVRSPRVERKVA